MLRVTMVCLGNICRSPMAAAVLDNKARKRGVNVTVSSAGTAGYHVGEGPNAMSYRVWSDAGYEYEHTAAQFHVGMFDDADLILVMDESNHANVMRLARTQSDADKVQFLRSFDSDIAHIDPTGAQRASLVVPDPWERPRAEFEAVLAMIERSVDGLLDSVAAGLV